MNAHFESKYQLQSIASKRIGIFRYVFIIIMIIILIKGCLLRLKQTLFRQVSVGHWYSSAKRNSNRNNYEACETIKSKLISMSCEIEEVFRIPLSRKLNLKFPVNFCQVFSIKFRSWFTLTSFINLTSRWPQNVNTSQCRQCPWPERRFQDIYFISIYFDYRLLNKTLGIVLETIEVVVK